MMTPETCRAVVRLNKLCNSFINNNLIHNFCKLHKIKFLYMFRASSAHPQEVNDVNCVCMQPLVSSFSAGGRLVHSLLSDCTRRPPAEKDHTIGCTHIHGVRKRLYPFFFTRDLLMRVWKEMVYRLDICRVTKGDHFESL
jgi:hypothetical protein